MGQPRVLVVADDAEAGQRYSTILVNGTDARTVWVRDAPLADRLLHGRLKFDVVLMDIGRPSEWSSCERLGHRSDAPPVVVISGWLANDGRFRRRAFDAGCAALIGNPCDPRVLVDTILRVRAGERRIGFA